MSLVLYFYIYVGEGYVNYEMYNFYYSFGVQVQYNSNQVHFSQ